MNIDFIYDPMDDLANDRELIDGTIVTGSELETYRTPLRQQASRSTLNYAYMTAKKSDRKKVDTVCLTDGYESYKIRNARRIFAGYNRAEEFDELCKALPDSLITNVLGSIMMNYMSGI